MIPSKSTIVTPNFDKFIKGYPKSSKVEEGAYLSAHSYYLASPVFSLDQKDTMEAITALQNFLYKYPESEYASEANKNIKELTFKLEKKSFEIAKQYYHTEDYIAAIAAFDNLLEQFLGTTLKEEALYLRFRSAFNLGMNSYILKKETRIKDAIKAHDKFKRNFPESNYLEETEKMVNNLNEELTNLPVIKTQTNGI